MEEKKCLKCGRPCREDQVFCKECLAEMEKYPVKPGVVVLLPPKEKPRPSRRRAAPPAAEEQLAKLKKRMAALRIALALALGAAGVFGWLAVSDWLDQEEIQLLPGQNYSSETTSAPSETE